jgi:hypothetical protein
MIKIIADENLKEVLQRSVEIRLANFEGNLTVVQLEHALHSRSRSKLDGLDDVLEAAPKGEPIVMLSMLRPRELANYSKWQAAMGYPNVTYCDILKINQDFVPAVQESVEQKRPKDELAIELVDRKLKQDELSVLRHDLYHVRAGNRDQQEWSERARKVFGGLPYEELAVMVESGQLPQGSSFEGRYLEGIFCDVEGTLIKNGQINQNLVAELQAKSQEKPVTIWTGGDVKEAGRVLRPAGVTWKILPKSEFAGARINEAYDDLNQDVFEKTYDIEVLNYHQVMPEDNEARELEFNPEIEPIS